MTLVSAIRWVYFHVVGTNNIYGNDTYLADGTKYSRMDQTKFVEDSLQKFLLRKKSFLLRISSVNVSKSTGNRGFGHIY